MFATQSLAPLRNPEIRALTGVRLFGGLAYGGLNVAIGWQIYQITKDPFWLGMVGLVEAVPALIFALFGGHIADRGNRRRVSLFAEGVIVLCALAYLWLSTVGTPLWLLQAMFAVIFVTGVAGGFSRPAFTAVEAQAIPDAIAPRVTSMLGLVSQIGMVASPLLIGVLIDAAGISVAFAACFVMGCIAMLCLFALKSRPVPVSDSHSESVWESLSAGARYVFGNQILVGSMALDLFAVLFGGAMALLPAFADSILNVGASGLGLLRTAPSLGALLVMAWLTARPPSRNSGRWLLGCVFGFGITFILFGLSTNFWLSLFLLVLSGVFDGVSMVIRLLILRNESPEHLRGRIAAFQWMFIGASNELGAFESGVAARIFGTAPSVVLGGIVTLLVVTATTVLAPKLRELHIKPS